MAEHGIKPPRRKAKPKKKRPGVGTLPSLKDVPKAERRRRKKARRAARKKETTMLYVNVEKGRAVSATTEYPNADREGRMRAGYETRNDWYTLERATVVAIELSDATGKHYVAIDAGPNVSPRYDVIDMPTVGAEVSAAFNGDYYPEGVIVKISASLRRIVTSTGKVFFRRGQSGTWIEGGTWSLVAGHVDRRNPSF